MRAFLFGDHVAKKLREIVVAVTADTAAYQREMNRVARTGSDYFKTIEQGARRADAAYQRNSAAIRMQITEWDAAGAAVGRFMRVAVGAFAGQKLVTYADDWGQIGSRLKFATEGVDQFNQAQDRLMSISSRVYKEYGQTAELFIRTNDSLAQLGYTSSQALDLVEAFSYGLTVSSASAEKSAIAVDALSKAILDGKMSVQQLSSLIGAAPALQQALSDALGVSNAQLRRMASEGRLTTAELMKLSSQIETLGKKADEMPTTAADALTRLGNELQRYVGQANEAYSVTSMFASGINLLSDNIGAVVEIAGAAALGVLASKMLQGVGAANDARKAWKANRLELIEQAKAQAAAAQMALRHAQAEARSAQVLLASAKGEDAKAAAIANVVRARATEVAATNAAATATARLDAVSKLSFASIGMSAKGLLGVLGGPVGLAVTLASMAAGWLLFRDNADSATAALRNMHGTADEVLKKFKELNVVQQKVAISDLEKQIRDAQAGLASGLRGLQNAPLKLRISPDFAAFREEVEKLAQSDLPFDDFQRQVYGLVDGLAKTVPNSRAARASMMEVVSSVIESRRAVDTLGERLRVLSGAQDGVAKSAASMSGIVTSAIGGMAEADWSKYLKNLESARDQIGLTARQVGEYRARAEGANDAQAALAGALAAQADAAQRLQRATAEKDQKAIQGAKETLRSLVLVEAQQRGIIAAAQEAVRLQASLASGVLSQAEFHLLVAAAGRNARDAAFREGTERTEGQIGAIGTNTPISKSGAKVGEDWGKWVKEKRADIAAQEALSAAYREGAVAVERATVASQAEAEVLKFGAKRRAEILQLLEQEAGARSEAEASKQLGEMSKEIALIDAQTEAERVLWETQNGAYAALSDNIKKALVGRAQELDAARRLSAQKTYIGEITGKTEADDTIEKMGWLADAFDRNEISAEQYRAALSKLTNNGLMDLTEFAVQGARNIQTYLGDALYDAVTGKFDDIGKSFFSLLARMASQAAAANIGQYLFGNFGTTNKVGGLLGAAGTAIGKWLSGGGTPAGDTVLGSLDGLTPITPSAKGNAFDSGKLVPFARGGAFTNGVVDAPVAFPMGLMGEAGPEAIMPLKRGSDGSLGVRVSFPTPTEAGHGGSGGASVGDIYVSVNIQPGGEVDTQTSGGHEQFGRGLGEVIRSFVQQELARFFRPGGLGWDARNGRLGGAY